MGTRTTSFRIEETSIAALHAGYVSGRATAISVCQAHLDRIAAYDRKGPALGAIIVNNPDAVRWVERCSKEVSVIIPGGWLSNEQVLITAFYTICGIRTRR